MNPPCSPTPCPNNQPVVTIVHAQNAPGLSRQKQWESSPDFKTMRVNARSTGSGLRGAWGVPGSSGASMVVGSPGFVGGSPGRMELTKTMQRMGSRTNSVDEVVVGSPHHRHQARDARPPPCARTSIILRRFTRLIANETRINRARSRQSDGSMRAMFHVPCSPVAVSRSPVHVPEPASFLGKFLGNRS